MTATVTAAARRAQAIELVVTGHDCGAIATRLKLSERHVRRILSGPEMRAQIRALEDERLHAVARKAAALGGSAVVVLAEIAKDTKQPAAARVSAARGLLDAMLKVGDLAALSERVGVLEDQLAATAEKGEPIWRKTG